MTTKRKYTHTHPRGWTDAEKAILRREWKNGKAVRLWMDLLPNRSERAIVGMGLDLGLGARGNTHQSGNSVTWRTMQRVLASGEALSPLELAERTGMSRSAIYGEIRIHYPADIHVGGYGPRVNDSGFRPKLWKLGAGKDAPRPKAMTGAERARKRWKMLKAERPDYLAARSARNKIKHAEKTGKLIRRDIAASWI